MGFWDKVFGRKKKSKRDEWYEDKDLIGDYPPDIEIGVVREKREKDQADEDEDKVRKDG